MLHLVLKSQATDAFVRSLCVDTAASALAARLQLTLVFIWGTGGSGKNRTDDYRCSVEVLFVQKVLGP